MIIDVTLHASKLLLSCTSVHLTLTYGLHLPLMYTVPACLLLVFKSPWARHFSLENITFKILEILLIWQFPNMSISTWEKINNSKGNNILLTRQFCSFSVLCTCIQALLNWSEIAVKVFLTGQICPLNCSCWQVHKNLGSFWWKIWENHIWTQVGRDRSYHIVKG